MPAGGLVCVCGTFPLSQPHQEPCQSLQSTRYLRVQACRRVHGFNLKYGNTEDCILLKKELFNNMSHHAINVDATLISSSASILSAVKDLAEERDAA